MATLQAILWFVAVMYLPVVLCWWYFGLYYLRRLQREPLRPEPVVGWPPDRPAPSLAVIIACHNEADGIEACLRGLLRQTYPNFRIVVANDRSTDETGAIVRRLAETDPRIEVLDIRALPSGWTGKAHAVAAAARHATADYLLFADSDVDLASHTLNTVMHKVGTEGIEFFSFWPRLELRSWSEKLLTPPALVFLSLWALPLVPRGDIAGTAPVGNGQFMLVKRSTYEALGGHAAAASELAEDAVLAARAHAAGVRCWAGLGEGLYTTYRTGGPRRTLNALARVFLGSVPQQRRLWAGTQVLLGGGFTPVWIVPLTAVLLGLGYPLWPAGLLLLLGGLHWIGMAVTLRQAFGMTLVHRGPVLWFPIGALLVAGVLVWCSYLLSGRGTVRWGATRYRVRGSQVLAAQE